LSRNTIDAKRESCLARAWALGAGAKLLMTMTFDSRGAMAQRSYPLRFALVALAGWINQQRNVIDYLERGEPRPAGTARPGTAAVYGRSTSSSGGEGQDTGRRVLRDIATIVTPDSRLWLLKSPFLLRPLMLRPATDTLLR
jgi:hypothetical protein